jgi:hypothetical protein
MSKIKRLLEEDMMRNPELYNGWSDYEFWIQCRKEAILEREGMDSETNKTKGNKDGKIPTR